MSRNSTSHALRRDDLAALSGIYRLLARLWLREGDRALLRELSSAPLRDVFCQAGGVLPTGSATEAEERLAVEFCQLFVGPAGHLPPFQSVWQTGQFQSPAATAMREFIDLSGYEQSRLPSGIMLDHLGVQLDVMGHLTQVCSAAASEDEQADVLLDMSRSYFFRHLTWPSPLLDAAESRARSEFYRSVARMTRDFLGSEQSYWRNPKHGLNM